MAESLAEALRARALEEARRATASPAAGADDGTSLPTGPAALAWLERFLGPAKGGDGTSTGSDGSPAAPAARRLGRRAARGYARALGVRRPLLEDALAGAAALPPTRADTAAPLAPAGTALHVLAGDPARLVATWLDLGHGHGDGATREALLAYREALAEAGYASARALDAGLPGAVCLGVLAELPGFPGGATEERSRERLRETLGRVLDLADTLTLASPAHVLAHAADHAAHGRAHRARRLLATRLERAPEDAPCACALARAERVRGRFGRARRALEGAAAHHPDDAALAAELARTRRVAAWIEEADAPERMPRVALDEEERARGRFHEDTLAAAATLYERHGTLLIEDAFDPALLDACRAQFLDDYRDYLDDRRHPDALRIGDRRFQVSIAIRGAFNDPRFYANPFVLSLVHRLLDRQAIVGSTVCATSLPGSRDQHLHKDHRALFTDDVDDEPPSIPPVAVTTMIPLVALDERVGTTLVRKGSHRRSRRASERLPAQTPIVPLGSCFLMDLALSHQGQGNRTDIVRPIVNMQYTRRWFVDNKNFHRQRPLEIRREEYARIPDEHRPLFDWARQPGPRVDR